MTYLLDVSVLLALLYKRHAHHQRVSDWDRSGVKLAVCPLSQLGFLRISTQPVFGATVKDARKALREWREKRKPEFIACDMDALDTQAPSVGSKTTDFYLASLAEQRGMALATLDEGIAHKAVFVIPA